MKVLAFWIICSLLWLKADDLGGSFPASRYDDDLAVLSHLKTHNPDFKLEYFVADQKSGSSFYVLSDNAGEKLIVCRLGEVQIDAKLDDVKVDKGDYFEPLKMKVSGQIQNSDGSTEDTSSGSLVFDVGHYLKKPSKGELVVNFSQTKNPKMAFEVKFGEDVGFSVNEISMKRD